jgi:hypothetical protein
MTDLPRGYEYLLSDNVRERQAVLRALSHRPTGDPRVLPFIERMLEDTRPCIISLPIEYGEVRMRAAEALAAERKAQNINDPVRLIGVAVPLTPTTLHRLCQEAGLPMVMESWQARFERLREMGMLPLGDIEL